MLEKGALSFCTHPISLNPVNIQPGSCRCPIPGHAVPIHLIPPMALYPVHKGLYLLAKNIIDNQPYLRFHRKLIYDGGNRIVSFNGNYSSASFVWRVVALDDLGGNRYTVKNFNIEQ